MTAGKTPVLTPLCRLELDNKLANYELSDFRNNIFNEITQLIKYIWQTEPINND